MATGFAGTVFLGPEGLSQFGRKVRAVGDLNNDGITDFAIAAPNAGNGYGDEMGDSVDQAGIAYVIYGQDGDFAASYDFAFDGSLSPDGSFFSVIEGDLANGRISEALNGAGDLNGDGIDDLVVGSDRYGDGGAAFVLFGQAGGLAPLTITGSIGPGAGAALTGESGDQFSIEAEGIGDFNGDGHDDLYVSSQNNNQVIIQFGTGSGLGDRLTLTETDTRGAPVGDLNGDGLGDIAVKARSGPDLLILFGADSWGPGTRSLDDITPDGMNGFSFASGSPWVTEGVGDVNGDGLGDLLVLSTSGDAALVFGSDSGFPASLAPEDLDGSNGMRLTGGGVSFQIGGVGDINGDGLRDFVLGNQNGGTGTAFVVFGQSSGHPAELDLTTLDGTNGYRIQGVNTNDNLAGGQLGDFNNDGFADLIAGAARFDGPAGPSGIPNWDVGGAVLIYGGPERLRAFDGADGSVDGLLSLTELGTELSFDEPDPVPIGGGEEPTPIEGTPGQDVLTGTGGDDTILGFAANDRLIGEAGNDSLDGGTGADTLNGGEGDDTILGGPSDDDLRDVVFAGGGNDSVDAGAGNDQVFGQGGNDTIAGGAGVDDLQGQDGDDVITGSNFSDLVFGGAGNDFVNGGFGSDRINGGDGADKFFHAGVRGHGSDWLQDYSSAEGDVLLWGGGAATADDFQVNFAHTENAEGKRAGEDDVTEGFVIYKPSGQIIWALVDGGGQDAINIQIGGDTFDLLG